MSGTVPRHGPRTNFSLGLQFPVRSATVQLGASAGSGIEGTLRIGFQLP